MIKTETVESFEEIFLANLLSEKSSSTAVQLTQSILMLKPDGAFN